MRIVQRAFILFLVFVQIAIPVAFSEEKQDVHQDDFEQNIGVLTALGVWKLSGVQAGSIITRGEFAQAVVDLFGFPATKSDAEFIDVLDNNPNSAGIQTLSAMGIMSGVNPLRFEPNTPITYAQSVKTLVAALGYEAQAKAKGGFPTGYLQVANNIGLLKNIAAEYQAYVNGYLLSELFQNAKDTDVMEMVGMGTHTSYQIQKERSLLAVYHDIYHGSGTMTDNGITTFTKVSEIGGNNVRIGDVILSGGMPEIREMIGRRVEYYYQEQDHQNTLLYIRVDERKNKAIRIKAEDLHTEGFSKTKLQYNSENKLESLAVDQYANLIYNGAAYPIFVTDTLKIRSGSLTLIDTDNDNVYDLIVAEEYENFILSVVDTKQKILYDKFSDMIEYHQYRYCELYNEAGKEIEFSALTANMVLSVMKSKDFTKVKMIATQKTTDGVIEEVADDTSKPYIKVGGIEYRLSVSFMDNVKKGYYDVSLPQVGTKTKLFFDYLGDIAEVEVVSDKYEYVYFVSIMAGTGFESDKALLQAVTSSGDCVVLKTARKVYINQSKDDADGINVLQISDLYSNGKIVPQLIKVKLNGTGEVTKIETSRTVTTNPYGFDSTKFTKVYYETNTTFYNFINFNGKYNMGANTVVFVVPDPNNIDPDEIRTIPYNMIKIPYIGNVEMFDADPTWTVGACVLYEKTNYDEQIMVVKSVNAIINQNGDTVKKITGYWKNNEWTFFEAKPGVVEKAAPGGLVMGDIIRFSNDFDSNIDKIELISSPSKNKNDSIRLVEGALANGTFAALLGRVYAKSPKAISLSADNGATMFAHGINSLTKFVLVDLQNKTVSKASYADVPVSASFSADGSVQVSDNNTKVFIWRVRGGISDCVIIKYN